MNTASLSATLILFIIVRNSQCSINAVNQEYVNLAENYVRWMQKSWTPDMFAFQGHISPPGLTINSKPAVVDSVQYVSGASNLLFKDLESQCSRDLVHIVDSLESDWARKMLDADGKPPSGLLGGNFKWPGDYTECKNIYAPPQLNKKNESVGNFHGRYCSGAVVLNTNSTFLLLPFAIGLCVPDTCDGPEIMSDINNALSIIERIPKLNKLNGTVNLGLVSCKPLKVELDGPAIGMICLLSVLGFFIAAGSSITVFEYFFPSPKKGSSYSAKHLTAQNDSENAAAGGESINYVTTTGENLVIECSQNGTDDKHVLVDSSPEQKSSVSIFTRFVKPFLKSFCIFTNGAKILNTDVAEGQLLCIHGIRFLSMAWVILGHTYAFAALNCIANLFETIETVDTWEFQVILQGTLSVDSFFVLSGFLLTYLFLKEADKKDGKISWPLFYFHRYWRLTPVYMFTLGFDVALTKYLASGPFWSESGFEVSCKETWWRNLLYINNFGDSTKQCFGWAWYLANDMQFYVISPIFLYALWRWPKAGLSIIGTLIMSSWITSAVITVHYNLIATYGTAGATNNMDQVMNQMGDYFWQMYVKPYTRISPYLIGVLVGYILYKTGNKKKFLEPWSQILGWSIATALPLLVIFAVFHAKFTTSSAAAYNALSRSAFSIGLAWVIYACQTGHADIVNRILSWKMFIPLSRLTYCAYLVHPIVIIGFYQSLLQPLYFSNIFAVLLFFGFLVMSYMIALITSLTLESPMMGIEKLLLKKR